MANTKSQMRWKASNPEKLREYAATHRRRNPNKILARKAVASAIAKGDLVRPDVCEDCGRYDGWQGRTLSTIEAHHIDYSKPFDIEWLCRSCHEEADRELV